MNWRKITIFFISTLTEGSCLNGFVNVNQFGWISGFFHLKSSWRDHWTRARDYFFKNRSNFPCIVVCVCWWCTLCRSSITYWIWLWRNPICCPVTGLMFHFIFVLVQRFSLFIIPIAVENRCWFGVRSRTCCSVWAGRWLWCMSCTKCFL